ncbi:MAG: NADH-quinone oxidoreductase subunit D [Anaerolinea sp.]|nr:NADH-quinone oxidoreductase subunit D [Anaerolinea sp.]MCC6975067.1 NADH-quinone oxidoreductase subunit D [Anaerolineae bacterium]CAG1012263.1 NADH-quinone oxidoreductase subunit C/D [Anaerolineae bacterium]
MSDQVQNPVLDASGVADALVQRFPDAVKKDTRKGYEGVIIDHHKLLEVAGAIRDDYGFNYLSSLTAVDYLGMGDHMEVVYHAFRVPTGGAPLVFKAQTDRVEPTIPSLVKVYPGADFQEREAYDLYGIYFPGHPNLKRILLWDGFEGHPMRKDWKEAYYEQEHKPFDSRWPGGNVFRGEEHNPFGHNVRYPAGFNLDNFTPQTEAQFQSEMSLGVDIMGDPAFTNERLLVNLGPHHPSTHGVFRMMVQLNGETIESLEPVMGYLHRNHEKIGERNTWFGNMPFTDRLDYLSSMGNNLGYALAVEKLLGSQVKIPYRAEVIRVLMAELTRITNHLWAIGFLLNDLGAFFTPALYCIQTREYILDFFEATAGSRMMCNYMRFGGVFKDLPERIRAEALLLNDKVRDMDTMQYLKDLITERIPRSIDELDEYLSDSEIIASRCIGVGVLPADVAIANSAAGPLLRASGVPYDLRRALPYSIYPELEFDVVTRPNGDLLDRYFVRLDEMRESVRILKQILPLLEKTKGESIFGGKTSYSIKAPAGESYGMVENPKGELGYYVVSDGGGNPWRYHVRAPSFINLTTLGLMAKGHKVADVVAILGGIDIVLGETDR